MWISKSKYKQLNLDLETLATENVKLIKVNKTLLKKVKILENDKKILLNLINPDIPEFPNTDERGLGDSDTPIDISELFSNF